MKKRIKAKQIPAFSIVRIPDPDGRIGYIIHNTEADESRVVIPTSEDSFGVSVSESTELEIIRYPGELARLWLLDHRPLADEARRDANLVWVDVPNPHNLECSWINVAEFDDWDQALAFTRRTFGADEQGRINLITVGAEEND